MKTSNLDLSELKKIVKKVKKNNYQYLGGKCNMLFIDYNFHKLCGTYVKLHAIKKTQCEMFHDRGYELIEDNIDKSIIDFEKSLLKLPNTKIDKMLSIIDFVKLYCDEDFESNNSSSKLFDLLSTSYTFPQSNSNTSSEKIIKVFYNVPKVSKKVNIEISPSDIEDKISIINDSDDNYKYFLINIVPLSSMASEYIRNLCNIKNIEVFEGKRMFINPTKHFLSPKFTLLDDKQNEQLKKLLLKKDHPLKLKSLPVMKVDDPIAKYYGAKGGDVFKVENHIIVSGSIVNKNIYYRHVINF